MNSLPARQTSYYGDVLLSFAQFAKTELYGSVLCAMRVAIGRFTIFFRQKFEMYFLQTSGMTVCSLEFLSPRVAS